jgi:hypothetical protein
MPTMSGLTSTATRKVKSETEKNVAQTETFRDTSRSTRPHVTHPRTAPQKSLYLLSSVPLVAKRVADIFEGSLADATRQPYHVAASSVKTEVRLQRSCAGPRLDYQVCTQRLPGVYTA